MYLQFLSQDLFKLLININQGTHNSVSFPSIKEKKFEMTICIYGGQMYEKCSCRLKVPILLNLQDGRFSISFSLSVSLFVLAALRCFARKLYPAWFDGLLTVYYERFLLLLRTSSKTFRKSGRPERKLDR